MPVSWRRSRLTRTETKLKRSKLQTDKHGIVITITRRTSISTRPLWIIFVIYIHHWYMSNTRSFMRSFRIWALTKQSDTTQCLALPPFQNLRIKYMVPHNFNMYSIPLVVSQPSKATAAQVGHQPAQETQVQPFSKIVSYQTKKT